MRRAVRLWIAAATGPEVGAGIANRSVKAGGAIAAIASLVTARGPWSTPIRQA
jgi:hypothetical protein